jgi:predicted component of type VI protein secretion system
MRKVLSLILAVTMLFALTVSVSGCGSDTDYSSPIRAVTAYKKGHNVIGKTVTFVITGIDDHNAPTFYLEGDVVS